MKKHNDHPVGRSSDPASSSDAEFTLITGSSQGIGRAMAEVCAQRGMPVLLVALDDQHLAETVGSLRERFAVPVHALGIDLTQPDATARVYAWCQEQGFEVVHLINNAGFGRNGLLEQVPLEQYQDMMALNNRAMVELTHRFLPQLKARRRARILNMSSIEYAMPLPYKAVYAGTKNFVYAFSLALAEELRPFGISVSVLCPGPVVTNADGLKRIQTQGKSARAIVMMPEQVAPIAIRGMLAGKSVIVPGRFPNFLAGLAHFVPRRFKMRLLERMFRQYKELPEVPDSVGAAVQSVGQRQES